MPRITEELIRKRSEHNEGIISTLEEISLHQEELEKMEVLGTLCRKLKILYLQNNIIEKMEDLTHMKDLQYLNLALNNIKKIEGLHNCEFLSKLDLTVNFIALENLEESIDNLKPLEHLKELFMMGNPAQSDWEEGFKDYVIASLPQLQSLDGKEITRTDRIKASQRFESLQSELRAVAQMKREESTEDRTNRVECKEKSGATSTEIQVVDVVEGTATDISSPSAKSSESKKEDEKTPYTPECRREMYLELAEQKEEQENRSKQNMPRERNYAKEHEEALHRARMREENGEIRQCNEGKWDFHIEEDDVPGFVIVQIGLPKYLDSSLINVDVHPTFITVIVKNKTIRLRLPEECHSDSGKAERSRTTGELKLTLPKVDQSSVERSLRAKAMKEKMNEKENGKRLDNAPQREKPVKLAEQVLEEAVKVSKAVNLRGIVKKKKDVDSEMDAYDRSAFVKEVATTYSRPVEYPEDLDGDEPPPIF